MRLIIQLVWYILKQFTVEKKKMAAVHFTAIPCEPITAYKAQRKPNFTKFVPVLRTLSSLGLRIYNVSVRF